MFMTDFHNWRSVSSGVGIFSGAAAFGHWTMVYRLLARPKTRLMTCNQQCVFSASALVSAQVIALSSVRQESVRLTALKNLWQILWLVSRGYYLTI
jgi:hypothetical protein